MIHPHKTEGGYALIISVVIVATILLMLATISARRVQDGFFAAIHIQQIRNAQALAQGCAYEALLRRATNSQYAGNEIITIQGLTCVIRPSSGQTIEVEAQSQGCTFRLRIELTLDEPPKIANWERVSTF